MAKRLTTILELLRCSKKVGKTFIQKAIYVLQNWLDWDSEYKFKLHYYGPYSSDLSGDLDILSELGLIKMVFNGHSYEIAITEEGLRFLDEHLEAYMLDRTKIERAIALVGKEDVRNMELIGTALYFSKLSNDESEIVRLVNTVKPHFNEDTIKGTIKYLREEGILSR
jgi:hypothetical protein